jgi:hypothetical protein
MSLFNGNHTVVVVILSKRLFAAKDPGEPCDAAGSEEKKRAHASRFLRRNNHASGLHPYLPHDQTYIACVLRSQSNWVTTER